MVDDASRKEIFIVPSSAVLRVDLESRGANVRRDEPSSGAIGWLHYCLHWAQYTVNTACAIATTVGASGDIMHAERLYAVNR